MASICPLGYVAYPAIHLDIINADGADYTFFSFNPRVFSFRIVLSKSCSFTKI